MRLKHSHERRGVILMVVLSLLTLFAIVGITFVLYADSEATAARLAREAESPRGADVDPEQALALFLSQFIYDVNDDASGVGSGLRGHSLARTMYGYNYPLAIGTTGSNVTPYNGIGRLHYTHPGPVAIAGTDDYNLVNYTWFSGDGFLRDPERYGLRSQNNPAAAQSNTYIPGNAPYTYPDLNNFYLGLINGRGFLTTPSYHRAWLFNTGYKQGAPFNDLGNPNWWNKQGKYLTLRPRPAEHPNFPGPGDGVGDVKNLVWMPGGNDSIWIDIGAPVKTAPDGTKYKMLVAPLIIDLDGRINLNVCGNVLGLQNGAAALYHVSNQGWGPWEVSLAKVLYGDTPSNYAASKEWTKLFGTNGTSYGRYGVDQRPTNSGGSAASGSAAHFYAPVDSNGLNEATPNNPSSRPAPPVGANVWATFGQGYLSGGPELLNHPLRYIPYRGSTYIAGNDDRVFSAADMEPLLRPNSLAAQWQDPVDTNSSGLVSDLLRLCPLNFGPNAQGPPSAAGGPTPPPYRGMVTTISNDLGSPGLIPYWWSTGGVTAGAYTSPNPQTAPVGAPVPFPTIPPSPGPLPVVKNTGVNHSEFGADWRSLASTVSRIRLNRPLPPYPHMGSGAVPPYGAPLAGFGTAYDLSNPNSPITIQYNAALNARQTLASDIYSVLLGVTGVPRIVGAPPVADLSTRRWLAQLAVNIVDYIDEDDISTAFNFCVPADPKVGPGQHIGDVQPAGINDGIGPNPGNQSGNNTTGANPTYWVFGTELPRVVLNEALAEAQNSQGLVKNTIAGSDEVQVWVELHNTMQVPAAGSNNTQVQDANPISLFVANGVGATKGYSPYRVTIARNLMPSPPLTDTAANVLGKENLITTPVPQSTTDLDLNTVVSSSTGKGLPSVIPPNGFLLVGPPVEPAGANYRDPFTDPTIPANTPLVRTAHMTYKTPFWNPAADERTTGLTILLRRLANPYLPFNGSPSIPNPGNPGSFIPNPLYNPYVTVDYLDKIPIRSNGVPLPPLPLPKPVVLPNYASRGKRQPYAGLTQAAGPGLVGKLWTWPAPNGGSPVADQAGAPKPSGVSHTFGQPNNPLPQSGSYDWLVHLDRQVISPLELLHVSAWPPYQLAQKFISGSNAVATNKFQHYAPWLDAPPNPVMAAPWFYDATLAAGQSHRLYRLLEFFESNDRVIGANGQGRIPGRVNLNTISYGDKELLRAICDVNPTTIGLTDKQIDFIFELMYLSRTPGVITLTANDRPYLPLGVGRVPAGGTQFPNNGISVTQDTMLRMGNVFPQPPSGTFVFQDWTHTSAVHPYQQTQLLTKMYNNTTVRSNTFAVFLTVGFFEVEPGGAVGQPSVPRLGAEIGRREGRQVRHRMFAIVDRTNLQAFGSASATPVAGPTATPSMAYPQGNVNGSATITLTTPGWQPPNGTSTATYTNRAGLTWSISSGSQLVIEPGTANEETVTVTGLQVIPNPKAPMNNNICLLQITANFSKPHPNAALTGNSGGYSVIQRGNPGPQPTYDPRQDPLVVPYFSIID